MQAGVRNDPQQIQDDGVPSSPTRHNYLRHYILNRNTSRKNNAERSGAEGKREEGRGSSSDRNPVSSGFT